MEQNIVKLQISNEYITGSGVSIGAVGSHDDVLLEMDFRLSAVWAGTTRRAIFANALGENRTVIVLTTNLLEEGQGEIYLVPVPKQAKDVAGECFLTVEGFVTDKAGKEIVRCVTKEARFRVLPSKLYTNDSAPVTPSQAEQLQAEIDYLKPQIMLASNAAKNEADRQEKSAAMQVWEDYDPLKPYVALNKVAWEGSSYICIKPCTGVVPSDEEYWLMIARKGQDGSTVPNDAQYGFSVEDGHLILYYTGDVAPDYSINSEGHLILNLESSHQIDVGKVTGTDGEDGQAATLELTGAESLPAGSAPAVVEQTGSTAQTRKYLLKIPSGADGISPTVSVEEIDGGHRVTVTDAGGEKAFDVMDGEPGPQGPQGPAGVTPALSIGTVDTLPAGSQATASFGGTDAEPVLNLGLPQGMPGESAEGGEAVYQAEYTAAEYVDSYFAPFPTGQCGKILFSIFLQADASTAITTKIVVGGRSPAAAISNGTSNTLWAEINLFLSDARRYYTVTFGAGNNQSGRTNTGGPLQYASASEDGFIITSLPAGARVLIWGIKA